MPKRFIIDVWYGSKYTAEVVQDSKIGLKWMSAEMLEKTVHFHNMDLAGDTPRRDIPSIRSNSLHMFCWIVVLKNYAKFTVMHRWLFFNLQPATLSKKRRRHTYFSVNFASFFTSNLVTEKLLRIGFDRRILQKMANRHSYYKESFQKT